MYDVTTDPYETKNVADFKEYGGIRRRLSKRLRRKMMRNN